MGEDHNCRPHYDPNGTLKALKSATREYPPRLKRALIQDHLWEARFALDTCRKSATRGDAFYVAGCLFHCAACMVQALFALNERLIVNEKRSVAASASLQICPANFRETVDSVLARPGGRPEQLEESAGRFGNLLGAVERLCAEPMRNLDELG